MAQFSEYEMVNRQEWGRQISRPDDLHGLDNDWYPILSRYLKETDEYDGKSKKKEKKKPSKIGKSFDPYDTFDGRGSFDAREFEDELRELQRSGELENNLGISLHKIKEIIRRADTDKDGCIQYKDFIKVIQEYRLTSEQASRLKTVATAFAYAEEFTCRPPTFFMIIITIIETAFFVYHCVHLSAEHDLTITANGPVPYCSVLIYNPHRRWEAWRYFTYMFVHIGITHYVFNMIIQILVGVFLEMEQYGYMGSLRIMAIYFSGVIAGSLGTSLSDPNTYIAGASGGVYALIAAHLATMLLNWREDSAIKIQKVVQRPLTRIVRIVFISLLTIHDVGFAIYVRLYERTENRTGFMGHFCGALAGLLVGVFALENRRVKSWEPYVQWASLGLFAIFIIIAIVLNIFGNDWWPGFFPPSDYRLYDDESGNCKHYEYI